MRKGIIMESYEVIIVGSGPAGIFAAMTLTELGVGGVIILEQGKDISERNRKERHDLLCGWGGAGAFSDGKLIVSTEVGGFLNEFVEHDVLEELLNEADAQYVKYGAPKHVYGNISETYELLRRKAKLARMEFVPTRIRHIGTENCQEILKRLRSDLDQRVEIRTGTQVREIWVENKDVKGVVLESGERLRGRFVVCAPGRSGANWMKQEAMRLGISCVPSPVDIGLRIETPAEVLRPLTDIVYESKLIYYSKTFDDRVRTFCMNPYGEVVVEEHDDIITVNGHSYASHKTENSNFAILVSSTFTEPFDDPIGYGRYIARLANILGKGPIVQRLEDLLVGRRSTHERISKCVTHPTLASAIPGDLSFVMPYRYLKDILEMLESMDQIAPGIFSKYTILYGVEVKFYSSRIKLSKQLESEIRNLFVIGDGAGITRGLLQSSASGILVGREIQRRAKSQTM